MPFALCTVSAYVVKIQSPDSIQGGLLHAYLPDIQFSDRVQGGLLSICVKFNLLTGSKAVYCLPA
jgi:hypothetical protein